MKDNIICETKGITIITMGILTIIVAIAGATFAFFQVTASDDIVGGSSGYVDTPLELIVTHETNSSVGTKKLIPQSDTGIQAAVTGTNGASCIDSSGNAVCKVFSITVNNKTTTNYYLNGTLTFATTPETTATTGMPNLKWAKGSTATTGFPGASGPYYSTFSTFGVAENTTTTTKLNDVFLLTASGTPGATKTFYIVVWISDTDIVQNDNGTFTGTVTFDGYSDSDATVTGITSTIRSDL